MGEKGVAKKVGMEISRKIFERVTGREPLSQPQKRRKKITCGRRQKLQRGYSWVRGMAIAKPTWSVKGELGSIERANAQRFG